MINLFRCLLLAAATASSASVVRAKEASDPILTLAQQIESRLDARVGLAIYDLHDGRSWEFRENERFPMASTFKALACAALLARDEKTEAAAVQISASELVPYSPVTETLIGKTVAASELCKATLHTSDNTAANKVLEVLGGPGEVTAFLRTIGDKLTQLDRWEPELNEGTPGDIRDTTTPSAMAATLRTLLLGDSLDEAAKDKLTSWMLGNEVGGPLLRAGVPTSWKIADRTGGGGHGTRGIAAIMWPPNRQPIVATIYITQTDASMEERNGAIADLGRTLASVVERSPALDP